MIHIIPQCTYSKLYLKHATHFDIVGLKPAELICGCLLINNGQVLNIGRNNNNYN